MSIVDVGSRVCGVDACGRKAHARGLCPTHYSRWRTHGDPTKSLWRRKADPRYTVRAETCAIGGCGRLARARGWCLKHYQRWRDHADTAVVEVAWRYSRDVSDWDRFWDRVEVGLCWQWIGSTDRGYGVFGVEGTHRRAHRWAWEQLVGPIPSGIVLDHLCRNPRCVNPDHLEPVTRAENTRRGFAALWW